MAGVKGKSGGARPNSGGKRPGAGRKPKAKPQESANAPAVSTELDPAKALMDGTAREPLEFLELVLNTPAAPLKDRIRAAIAAAQYRHTKLHDGGKKDEVGSRAEKAAKGKFAPKAPPRLVVNNRGG